MGFHVGPADRAFCKLVRRMDQLSWSGKIDPRQSYQLALNVSSDSCKSRPLSSKACASSHLCTFLVLQIALVAADTFSCAQLFLSFLYLVSMEVSGTGYYPSNALVSCRAHFSPSWHLVGASVGFCRVLQWCVMTCSNFTYLEGCC